MHERILRLNIAGSPVEWLNWEDAVTLQGSRDGRLDAGLSVYDCQRWTIETHRHAVDTGPALDHGLCRSSF